MIRADGGRRLLGRYRDASWSPRGLFVTALGLHDVVALEPNGAVRWSLARSGRLASPRWSPEIDGSTRIAYLRGDTLRVVAGDSTGDRLLDPAVASTAPAWKPGESFVLTYLTAAGRIRVVDTETGKLLWNSFRLPAVTELAWSDDGTRLLALTRRSLTVFGERGQRKGRAFLPVEGIAAAFEPGGHRIAVLLRYPQQSAVQLRDGDAPGASARSVFRADGRFGTLAWSPDGRWLLTGWKSANAFMFVTPGGRQRVVADIARQLGAFPDVPQAGWCCAASP
jgi:WD40 repeat protein